MFRFYCAIKLNLKTGRDSMSSVMSHRTMGHCTSVVWREIFWCLFRRYAVLVSLLNKWFLEHIVKTELFYTFIFYFFFGVSPR